VSSANLLQILELSELYGFEIFFLTSR